jgi:hypothetical protein
MELEPADGIVIVVEKAVAYTGKLFMPDDTGAKEYVVHAAAEDTGYLAGDSVVPNFKEGSVITLDKVKYMFFKADGIFAKVL